MSEPCGFELQHIARPLWKNVNESQNWRATTWHTRTVMVILQNALATKWIQLIPKDATQNTSQKRTVPQVLQWCVRYGFTISSSPQYRCSGSKIGTVEGRLSTCILGFCWGRLRFKLLLFFFCIRSDDTDLKFWPPLLLVECGKTSSTSAWVSWWESKSLRCPCVWSVPPKLPPLRMGIFSYEGPAILSVLWRPVRTVEIEGCVWCCWFGCPCSTSRSRVFHDWGGICSGKRGRGCFWAN